MLHFLFNWLRLIRFLLQFRIEMRHNLRILISHKTRFPQKKNTHIKHTSVSTYVKYLSDVCVPLNYQQQQHQKTYIHLHIFTDLSLSLKVYTKTYYDKRAPKIVITKVLETNPNLLFRICIKAHSFVHSINNTVYKKISWT